MLSKIVKTSEDFSKKVAAWNNSMIDKLEALRTKITKAHQIADGVILFLLCSNLECQYLWGSFVSRFVYRYLVKKTVRTMPVFVRINQSSWNPALETQSFCHMLLVQTKEMPYYFIFQAKLRYNNNFKRFICFYVFNLFFIIIIICLG